MRIFEAFNETLDLHIVPAVRDPQGACIEEENCNWERATVCAFNQTGAAGRVAFLACMDEREGLAPSASKYCAKKTGLDDGELASCYGGALGQQLLKEASAAWNHQFPSRATVPHTFINHKDVPAIYSQLKQAICAAGDTSPACSSDGRACSA